MIAKTNPFQSWIGFTRALELEFGPSPYECPRSTLFKLMQSGSVQDYYREFTALANRVQGIIADALFDCFLSSLKIDIRRDVIAQNPTSLLHAVSLAKLFEEKYLPKQKTTLTYPYLEYQSSSLAQTTKSTSLPPLLPNPNTTHQPSQQLVKSSNINKISAAEMQLRRETGLCFTCDAKFSPSHRCPNKQYLLLQLEEDEDFKLEPDPHQIQSSEQEHHLYFNTLKGAAGIGTMRFQGIINGVKVQVLLDSGSLNNFLQPRIAHCLKLAIEPTSKFQVLVGNGNSLIVECMMREVEVQIQGTL